MTRRAIVTGGAGFIGSHLVDALIAEGNDVVVLDDLSSGRLENLSAAEATGKLRFVEGSILDRDTLSEAMDGCDRVFHLAVQCVRRSLGKPIENHDVNATGTLYVLEESRRRGVERFLYCSSSEVYGNCGDERLKEDRSVCAPTTVYGGAKLAGEHYTQAYRQTYGLATTIVRPFNSYGPREHDQGDLAEVIPRFVFRVLNGKPPVIFGDGSNGRDFTYVTETARGILMAAQAPQATGQTINLAFGKMVSISDLATLVCSLCGRADLKPLRSEPRPGDVHKLQADTALAEQLLGFRASIGIEEGLREYLHWLRSKYPDPGLLEEQPERNWHMPAEPTLPQPSRSIAGATPR